MLKINKNGMVEGIPVRPTPNKSGAITPRVVILHDTAGSIENESSIAWLCNPQAKASAHFVIDRTGKITQLASCLVKTWHAGKSVFCGKQNVNDFSIGIEHVNPGKMLAGGRTAWGKVYLESQFDIQRIATPHHGDGYWMPYTEAQLNASLELLLAIRDEYGIEDIVPHWEISPGRKVDVNPLFPLQQFRGRLEGRQDNTFFLLARPGAILRKWPSFNAGNKISQIDDDGIFFPVRSGVFPVQGHVDEMPLEIASGMPEPQLWYKVIIETKDKPDTPAWIWHGHVKETRQ